jgi:beta-lactamase class A
MRLFVICLILLLSLVGCFYLYSTYISQKSSLVSVIIDDETDMSVHAMAISSPSPTAVPVVRNISFEKIISDYATIEQSIVYEDLKSGKRVEHNPDTVRIAASTSKLITAAYFLNQIEAGKQTYDQKLGVYPIKFQLEQMVNQSNNVSWEYFYNHLGRQNIQKYAKSIGLNNFDISKNTITAGDMAVLLKKLYRRELLSGENTSYLISLMQKTEDDSFIPDAKKHTMLFHKNGKLEVVVNEAIISTDPEHSFILSIYTDGKDVWGYEKRRELFHAIINAVLNAENSQ